MKRFLILLCAAVLTALFLCSCDKAMKDAGKTAESIAADVKDNADGMIDNGKVNDGDGYIGDSDRATSSPTVSPTDMTGTVEDITVYDDFTADGDEGVLDTGEETVDDSDFI